MLLYTKNDSERRRSISLISILSILHFNDIRY